MAKYYRHYLDKIDSPPDVPIGPLKGGKVALSSRASAVFDGLDKIVGLGNRVVLEQSTSGSDLWSGEASTPSNTVERRIARTRFDLTPGHFLGLSVMYVLSGITSADGSQGRVHIDIDWTDRGGTTTTTRHTLELSATASAQSDLWARIRTGKLSIRPGSVVGIVTSRDWSRHTHVNATASIEGSAKIIDLILYEKPHSMALEADDDDDYWTSGFFSSHDPEGATPNLPYPIQRQSETSPDGDRRRGSWQVMDQVHAQQLRMGPAIVNWTARVEEHDGSVTPDNDYIETTLATNLWTRIPDGAQDTDPLVLMADGQPGWSMATGAYARPVSENSQVSMATSGSIPVRIWIAISSDDPTLTQDYEIRIYTSEWSYIALSGTAPGTSAGTNSATWITAYGHLRCGQGPGDNVHATAMFRRTTTDRGMRIYALCVQKSDQYDYAT